MLKEITDSIEQELLKMIASAPASDLEDIQHTYKACKKIEEKLHSRIVDGTIAKNKLKKEEE